MSIFRGRMRPVGRWIGVHSRLPASRLAMGRDRTERMRWLMPFLRIVSPNPTMRPRWTVSGDHRGVGA